MRFDADMFLKRAAGGQVGNYWIGSGSFLAIGANTFPSLFEGLSAASAYAIIATWVTAAFAALLPRREWRAVPITVIAYAFMFCVAAGAGYEGFYREIRDVPWPARIGIAFVQALFAASPLVFAWSFDAFRERFRSWTSTSLT